MRSTTIRLIPHQNPDGDAIGAVSALGQYLRAAGKKVEFFCATETPQQLQFITLAHEISHNPQIWDTPCDVIVVCDSGDPVYAGIDQYLKKNPHTPVVVIDHHETNTFFGTLNLVSTAHSSTGELLYDYFKANNIQITPDIATALLCGIMYDTGSFSNSATSNKSLSVAGILIKSGASIKKIVQYIYKDKYINVLKLWGKALANLSYDRELDIASISISLEDMFVSGVDEERANGIANFMHTLKDGSVHMVFREKTDHTVKVSMRTTKDTIDVSLIAREFGGGGHKKAAGCTISAPLSHAYETMLPILKKHLKKI